MTRITDIATLEALYGAPNPMSLKKVSPRVTASYGRWIAAARFCVIASVGPEGTDVSPRGDDGPVVRIDAENRLSLPDWHGNNRTDTLRNIVRDGRVSLMFMVPGSNNVVRVNGHAFVTVDPASLASFARDGRLPRSVIEVEIAEVYFQCARALMRAGLWTRDDADGIPSAGEMTADAAPGAVDADTYDADWAGRARKTLW